MSSSADKVNWSRTMQLLSKSMENLDISPEEILEERRKLRQQEQERRRSAAMAGNFDMLMQSQLMETFEKSPSKENRQRCQEDAKEE